MSGVPLEPVYGPDGAELPGQFPYTRGPYASMYRSRLWTMRQFAGFGTAADTNGRFKELLRAGGDGLSTAFDMPTLLGRDSDDPLARGEVGRAGVAVDTQADMETLFAGIDLGPGLDVDDDQLAGRAHPGHVRRRGRQDRGRAGPPLGHAPERHLEGVPGPEGVRLPAAAVGAPRHRRHAVLRGRAAAVASRSRSRATTSGRPDRRRPRSWPSRWPTGSPTSRRRMAAGMAVDDFAPRLSFFFNAHMRLLRGDRQVPGRPAHLGPLDARPLRGERRPLAASCASTPRPPACR